MVRHKHSTAHALAPYVASVIASVAFTHAKADRSDPNTSVCAALQFSGPCQELSMTTCSLETATKDCDCMTMPGKTCHAAPPHQPSPCFSTPSPYPT